MADNVTLNSGSGGATLSTDEVTRASVVQQVQYVKLMNGTDGAIDVIPGDATNGLTVNLGSNNDVTVTGTVTVDGSGVTQPVSDAGGSLTVDNAALSVTGSGAEATALRVTLASDSTGVLSVDDNGASLTVDNSTLSVTGGGAEATALRVTLANDSTGVVSVDDNGGSLTVDHASLDLLHTADFDSGAGTDNTPAIGIAVAASGGAAVITGDTTNGLDVDVTRVSGTVTVDGSGVTQPVSGTVTANLSATDNAVLDQIDANTDYGAVVGGGAEATALRVTIANDSTGVVSIDDNGGSLTVDNGGTFAVQATLQTSTNTNEVVGDVAHDAVAAGNPVLVAASDETMADSAPSNRVSADGDASRLSSTDGALYVIPTGPQTWSYHSNGSAALTDATVHAAPGVGLSLYVTDIVFSSGAATAINMFFEESTTTVLGPYYLEATAGRGMAVHFGTPKKITANTALTVTTSAAIAHSVDVTGFIARG